MNKAVIGLGYGDEGKGMVVDYLCSELTNSLVVRFSGGHQVGHTVVRDGVRHIFSNYGSGTLLGRPTYWSPFCTVDPIGLFNEFKIIGPKGTTPKIYIDRACPVVTPWDKLANLYDKENRAHGTVGVGFGKTLLRTAQNCPFRVRDMENEWVLDQRVNNVMSFYPHITTAYGEFLNAVRWVVSNGFIEFCDGMPEWHDKVFEGSQGLLLDRDIGFQPHVTPSKTDATNIGLLGENVHKYYLVTRCYQTRHGNGPMTNEGMRPQADRSLDLTNTNDGTQGELRTGVLDTDMLKYAVTCSKIERFTLCMTCLEHMPGQYAMTVRGELNTFTDPDIMANRVAEIIGADDIMLFANHERIYPVKEIVHATH